MKSIIVILSLFIGLTEAHAQKKKVVYLDTLNNTIKTKVFLSILNTARYKWFWDESDKKTRYIKPIPTTQKEYDSLLTATENKILLKERIGMEFEYVEVTDINGNIYKPGELTNKILVINFWFVGCGPCEVEMPELNNIYEKYENHDDIIFLSFALSKEAKVIKFLEKNDFKYPVIIIPDDFAKKHQIKAYPTNFLIDRQGRYSFASQGINPGSVALLEKHLKAIITD